MTIFSFILLFFIVFTTGSLNYSLIAGTEAGEIVATNSTAEVQRPWLSEIFLEAEKEFSIHADASEACKRDFSLYKLHLKNNSIWAVRMSESSEWPKIGLFKRMTPAFGHFDECLGVNAFGVKGQYCLVESAYDFQEFADVRPKHSFDTPNEGSSVWIALQMYKNDVFRKERNKLVWTICVPASCSSSDLNESLKRTLHSVFDKYSMSIAANVAKNRCYTNEVELTPQYYYTKYFLSLLITIVIFSSIVEANSNNTAERLKMSQNVIRCFSMQTNYHKLVHVVRNDEYMLVHLFKVFGIFAVLLFHRYFCMVHYIYFDADAIEREVFLANHYNSGFWGIEFTTLFNFFSGFLMYRDFNRSSGKETATAIATKIAKRWIRLYSTYLFVRLFYTYIFPVVNDGPLWYKVEEEAGYCENNLLGALLTLPSARDENMCIIPSWMIAVDFQSFAIVYVCLSVSKYRRISAIKTLIVLLVSSWIVTFCLVFYNQYWVIEFLAVRHNLMKRRGSALFNATYMATVARIGPYILGTLVALMVHELKKKRYTLSKMQLIYASVVVIFLKCLVVISSRGLYELYNMNEHNLTWSALHGAYYQTLVNGPIIFFFFVYFVNGFEWLEKWIPSIIAVLSRLANPFALSHFVVVLSHAFSRRTLSTHSDPYSMLHLLVADSVLSYLFTFFWYFLIEGPVQQLVNLMSHNRKSKTCHQVDEDKVPKKEK